jgi:hypothetical protein
VVGGPGSLSSGMLAVAVLATGCAVSETPAALPPPGAAGDAAVVVVHRTESCSCCGSYEEYLATHGFEVETRIHEDIGEVKRTFGVPDEEGSCHTNELGGYFLEGHVPVEAIAALLDEAPDIDGITLAGMPAGSPGMPGEQTEPFVVRTVTDGEVVGELGRF